MGNIKIHVFHTGEVCVAPELPFGGENCNAVKASGIFDKAINRLWIPVSAYLIECDHGKILFDCGWHRDMSPEGKYDKAAQIKSLGSWALYKTNQGRIDKGQAIDEQLLSLGIKPEELDLVLLSHLDCDHANGLKLVKEAKKILVSNAELEFARKKSPVNIIRYHSEWWKDTKIEGFDWNGKEGPAGKSWKELITSGIAADKAAQKKSLEWIREQSLNENCVESLANHDPDVKPHIISL